MNNDMNTMIFLLPEPAEHGEVRGQGGHWHPQFLMAIEANPSISNELMTYITTYLPAHQIFGPAVGTDRWSFFLGTVEKGAKDINWH